MERQADTEPRTAERASPVRRRRVTVTPSDDPSEREAAAVASRVAASERAGEPGATGTSRRAAPPSMSDAVRRTAIPRGGVGEAVERTTSPAAENRVERAESSPAERRVARAESPVAENRPAQQVGRAIARSGSPIAEHRPSDAVERASSPNTSSPVARSGSPVADGRAEADTIARKDLGPAITPSGEQDTGPPPAMLPAETIDRAPGPTTSTGGDLEAEAADAVDALGPGRPLSGDVRSRLEAQFGRDLSDVRIHDSSADREQARRIDARAFTHGRDVVLGPGEHEDDTELIAHEVAHVVQNDGKVGRVSRADTTTGSSSPPASLTKLTIETSKAGSLSGGRLVLPSVNEPEFKSKRAESGRSSLERSQKLVYQGRGKRTGKQIANWEKAVRGKATEQFKKQLGKKLTVDESAVMSQDFLRFKLPKSKDEGGWEFAGTPADLLERSLRPLWTRGSDAGYRNMEVDHAHEHQIGGGDQIGNLWLLDREANSASGQSVKKSVNASITTFLTSSVKDSQPQQKVRDLLPAKFRNVDEIKASGLTIWWQKAGVGGEAPKHSHWEVEDLEKGLHLAPLVYFEGKPDRGAGNALVIYFNKTGGRPRKIANTAESDRDDAKAAKRADRTITYSSRDTLIVLSEATFTGAKAEAGKQVGTIKIDLSTKREGIAPSTMTVPLRGFPNQGWGGYIDQVEVKEKVKKEYLGLSPLTWDVFELREPGGLHAEGTISPTIPLIGQTTLGLEIRKGNVFVTKEFSSGDFSVPKPFSVGASSLVLRIGPTGVEIEGKVDFAIESVGEGHLGAAAKADLEKSSFALDGAFDFDAELFQKARVKAWYRRGEAASDVWGVAGDLVLKKNAVKGIRSGSLAVNYTEGVLTATGEVEPSIKGLKKGTMGLRYDPTTGLEIAGDLMLSDEVPGIKSGKLAAKLTKTEAGWSIGGALEAVPSVPGVDAKITGSYQDGLWLMSTKVGYKRGRLAGQVEVGVTNRKPDADGNLTDEIGADLVAFGGGSVSLVLTPWLKGTAGLKLKPNGEMIIDGKIGIPSTLDVFDKKSVKKRVFSINIDIPIVGVSAFGKRIGIFATIGGGLDAYAFIGPGQLTKAELGITYNPEREEDTVLTGSALFVIPAEAGLRLFVKGGIGAGILIVSAEGGIEVGAGLAVVAKASAGVEAKWTPAAGLVLDAKAEVTARPKLVFDVTGYVKVVVDYLFGSSDLVNKRWKLAGFELGTGLEVGATFPIHYESGKPFRPSFDDVSFRYPKIEPKRVMKDVVKELMK